MAAPDPRDAEPPPTLLERLVFLHFAALLVFASWAFGGQAPWVRDVLAGWGVLGAGLFVAACAAHPRDPRGPARHPALRLLWPLWAYDALVLASCANPGFRPARVAGEAALVLADPVRWLPSAALPGLAARELWLGNALFLSAFNLWLVLRRRRQLRAVLALVAGNGVALAVFGTVQQLVGAPGLWFGLVRSPNARFFSTFIYHNHWAAFALLDTAAALALFFHHLRRGGRRDRWHSPALLAAVGVVLLAASVPLSGSRSGTALLALLLGGALVHLLARVARTRRDRGAPAGWAVGGILLAAALALGAIGFLARDVIAQRAQTTAAQLAHLAREDALDSRLALYRDTWRMAAARPWFGWGLESYAHVFRIFNTQRAAETWVWIPYYAEAHNDWLQSLAEVGFVGTGLLLALLARLLAGAGRGGGRSLIPPYLLAGAGLLLVYATFEFPFANPAVVLTWCATLCAALRYAAPEEPPAPAG